MKEIKHLFSFNELSKFINYNIELSEPPETPKTPEIIDLILEMSNENKIFL